MPKKEYKQELINVLSKIKDPDLMDAFLSDLFTPGEYNDVVARLQIVKQLNRAVPQRDIARGLGVSISKVTRGSRELLDKKGGFRKILDKFY